MDLLTLLRFAAGAASVVFPLLPVYADQFVRPGEEITFSTVVTHFTPPPPKPFGTIGGLEAQLIETSCTSCEMGKRMIVDQDDNVWFLLTREDKAIKVDTKTLEMSEFKLPAGSGPYSVGIDSRGVLWMSAHGIEMLLELDPKNGSMTTHAPPSHGFLVHVNVDRRDDSVFFAQPGANRIVRYQRARGFSEYVIPTEQSGPARIDFDSKGNVWFPQLYSNKVAKLDPMSGLFTEWELPTPKGFPAFLRVDGRDAIWISQPMADRIVRFHEGKFREYLIPTQNSIVSTQDEDRKGFVWFTEGGWRGSAGGNKVGRLDPETGLVQELAIPIENAQPAGIVITRRGDIWLQLSAKGRLVRLTTPK